MCLRRALVAGLQSLKGVGEDGASPGWLLCIFLLGLGRGIRETG